MPHTPTLSQPCRTVDVRALYCPMTSVHVRAQLDAMAVGTVLAVLVRDTVTAGNVSAMVRLLRHELLPSADPCRLLVRKC
ncbi:sulfurtransferase TusA family protein [Formicincola oecophyllae]|uniref:Sulfurtransferase TusA family protein n=1 Tax=Formicincola oecophyllae TaxID=2558361 RepID=A0A4Y6UAK6_9PROT|nr:sulfurtransferase TusA family protein [Formicincola oecophyllae]QDH13608.1 sulfurtransferase TusA family protein [Formicincola oecophyllae]